MSKVDRIMLRFRPIAPKPATSESVSGGSVAEKNQVCARSGRGKRRCVTNNSCKKRCNNKKKKASSEEVGPCNRSISSGSFSDEETVVTLPLLPEIPERKEFPPRGSPSDLSDWTVAPKQAPIWLNFSSQPVKASHVSYGVGHVSICPDPAPLMMPQLVRLVGSIVTVECLTETWVDGEGLGRTDEEKRSNLGRDTCPGFVSDGLNRVEWCNEAYREMLGQDGEATVLLVMKDRLPLIDPALTCRVRVARTRGTEKRSLTLPCDVWRMEGGGFAWRLDVKAALSLGR